MDRRRECSSTKSLPMGCGAQKHSKENETKWTQDNCTTVSIARLTSLPELHLIATEKFLCFLCGGFQFLLFGDVIVVVQGRVDYELRRGDKWQGMTKKQKPIAIGTTTGSRVFAIVPVRWRWLASLMVAISCVLTGVRRRGKKWWETRRLSVLPPANARYINLEETFRRKYYDKVIKKLLYDVWWYCLMCLSFSASPSCTDACWHNIALHAMLPGN